MRRGHACMPILVFVERGQQYTVVLDRQEVIIGRSEQADLVLADSWTSRQHARVWFDGQRYLVQDLESTNGTKLNGRALNKPPVALEHGDRILVGRTVIRFIDPTRDTGELVLHPDRKDAGERDLSSLDSSKPTQVPPSKGARTQHLPDHRVFICHATQDDAYVDRLAVRLQQRTKLTAWVDHQAVEMGDWQLQVETALERSEVMIVVLSRHSVDSQYVKAEWNHFVKTKKPIFPVRIDGCRVPLFLNAYQVIDLAPDDEAGLDQIFVGIIKVLRENGRVPPGVSGL